jgi:hypothetical protein
VWCKQCEVAYAAYSSTAGDRWSVSKAASNGSLAH